MPHSIEVGDPIDHVVVQSSELRLVDLGRVRPCAVGMGEVGLPTDVVEVEVVQQARTHRIVDEAAQDALTEDLEPGP